MPVQIHINGETANEATKELRDLAAALLGKPSGAPAVEEPVKTDKPKPSRSTKKPEEETPAAEPEKVAEPEPDKTDEPENDTDEGGDDENVPTVVELRAKAQEVGTSTDAKKAIKALLDKYGCKSISDVPEAKRADFLTDLDLI